MKNIRIQIPYKGYMSYYYSSSKVLSDEEKVEKDKLENELANLVDVTDIGVRNSNFKVSVSKYEEYIIVKIYCEDYKLNENEI